MSVDQHESAPRSFIQLVTDFRSNPYRFATWLFVIYSTLISLYGLRYSLVVFITKIFWVNSERSKQM
nr:MAG TPA: hypothetical protein [Caudoviricetes sp.]